MNKNTPIMKKVDFPCKNDIENLNTALSNIDKEIELNEMEKEKLVSKQSKDLVDLLSKAEQIEYMMTNNEKKIAKLTIEEYKLNEKLDSIIAEKNQLK